MGKQQRSTKPGTNTLSGEQASQPASQSGLSNQAAQDQLRADLQAGAVSGPMGQMFSRIAGSPDAPGFDRDQLRHYLDKTLALADGEWFRGAKLDGVADKLIAQLDSDGDGIVSWAEFKAFEAQTLSTIAPGATDAASARSAAGTRFDQFDTDGNGRLGYNELATGSRAALPRGVDHADLISQLAARIALDAVDTDQRQTDVKDRDLSRDEWTTAAGEMAH